MGIPKATFRLLLLFFGGGFLFAFLAHTLHKSFVLGVFVIWIISAVVYLRMTCPRCHAHLGKRKLRTSVWPFPVWGLPFSRRCPHCGGPLP
jgi:hypothetical protein